MRLTANEQPSANELTSKAGGCKVRNAIRRVLGVCYNLRLCERRETGQAIFCFGNCARGGLSVLHATRGARDWCQRLRAEFAGRTSGSVCDGNRGAACEAAQG